MAKINMKKLAVEIVDKCGGEKNFISVDHCSTRLRIYVKDESKMDIDGLKKIKGVIDVDKATDQYQIIVGTFVEELCEEVKSTFGLENSKVKITKKKGFKHIVGSFLELLSGLFSPIIPALSAAGFVKVIQVLGSICGFIPEGSQTFIILGVLTDTAFYFLPIYLAYTCAKKFHTNEVLSIMFACFLIHPSLIGLFNSGEKIAYFGLPVTVTSYSSAVIPIILSIYVMSKIDKFLTNVIHDTIKAFLKPLCLVIFMSIIGLVVIGPLGQIISDYVAIGVSYIAENAGWFAVPVITALGPILGAGGMHLSLVPIAIQSIATVGYDKIINVWFLCFTVGSGAVALAAFLKTKKRNLKVLAGPAAISGLFGGISEPTLYGIEYKMKTPFLANCIGATIAATYAGFVGLKAYAFGGYSLTALAVYYGNNHDVANFTNACITAGISIVSCFLLTWFMKFDDSVYDEDNIKERVEKLEGKEVLDSEILAVSSGKLIEMKEIDDKVFSSGAIGTTYGIISEDGKIYSPCNGKVSMVFKSKHAIGITSDDGAELLIHIGIDSVNLNGEGINTHVTEGQVIRKGELIAEYNKDLFKDREIDETTIVVLTNSSNYSNIKVVGKENISKGDLVIMASK